MNGTEVIKELEVSENYLVVNKRLNKIDEKIKILRLKMDEEIKNIMKDRGLDESAKCDDELGMEIDGMSFELGLDDLYDEYDLLLNNMALQGMEV